MFTNNNHRFTNTIQDHKTKYLPYSKGVCMLITQIYTIFCHVMSIFGIFLLFSQIDFLVIRTIADLLVNQYTTTMFMQNKIVDWKRYEEECNMHSTDRNTSEAEVLLGVVVEEQKTP